MPLVNGRILLDRIQEKRVLAGAFNTTNLETTISILNAIERSGLPNFIQIAPTNAQLSGYDYIYEIVKRHADKMDVPVSLHLDHGKTQEDVKQAVRAGFTSVMIDGAALSFEENIAFTQEAVDFCKSYGVPVEAELGAILGKEDDHVSEADCKTEPEKVKTFVERTGCDMLAVFYWQRSWPGRYTAYRYPPAEAHCRSLPGAAGYSRRLRYRPGNITQLC
ncbi:putative fructose-1,6-bisphosphate aldolase [Escherichia coli]|uniref:Putative fructose-1,6-bisphosphate aldolase n=1 Tax=Escherichia coli TaxID=562 RepID=A0A376VCU7_ECOLX|nr:putative fructose-1,6-bisphosphate aldolase [Escherichia coli]